MDKKFTIIDAKIVTEIIKDPDYESEEYENFMIYSDDEYPHKLIDENRPNEHEIVKEYRKKTYQPVFSEVFDRVLNSLNKIQRADGFMLKFPDQSEFSKISKDEKLDVYLTKHFTASKSLFNWTFQVGLKQAVIDVNGVIILWNEEEVSETEYTKPTPYIINSDRIIYSYEGNSIVYKDDDDKNVYYSIDKYSWNKYKRDYKTNKYVMVEQSIHNLGIFPGFTIGGIVEEEEELGREYQSVFRAMLPWLNVATIEFSDLRAEITQHIHSTVWIYQDQQCATCNGNGWLMRENERVPCTNSECKGGQIPLSPYETLRVRPAKTSMGEVPAPTPPMGYIQKQTEIAELQDRRINEMRYRALAAVNMQFLESAPAQQSGVAKAYDRDETNNTFYSVATNLGLMMERISFLVAKWRYGSLYADADLKRMCPICIVPNTFDVLGSQTIVEEIKSAKDSTLNDAVLSEMELEFIKKRFPNDIQMQNKLRNAFELDPASGKTDEEKALLVSNRLMSKLDAIISTYIFDFVDRAIAENKDFINLTKAQKYAILEQYATEKLKNIEVKDAIVNKIFKVADTQTGSNDGPSPADLKYTVGGLTGIIEIVKAVSSGVYDLEAAIQMVMDRFGLTYEQAKAQLGTPQVIKTEEELNKITQLT